MEEDSCFVCAENVKDSYFFLINLASKKYKTKFTTLIGFLINKDSYELRVCENNKICPKCCVLLEKFDELQQEAKTLKSVLSRQIANTYNIETNEEQTFLDNSKVFVKLNPSADINDIKYSCKMCRFVTNQIDSVNSHCMYHKILTDSKIQTNEIIKDLTPTSKRNNPIGRETLNKSVFVKAAPVNQNLKEVLDEKELYEEDTNLELDEKSFENTIDLDLLEDEAYDSNLKNRRCMMSGCDEEFKFVADYVKHLKTKHKSCTLNHIFAVVRANIKRPNKVGKLTCPYCFSKAPNQEMLQSCVKFHEEAGKSQLFTDRLNEFVTNLIKISSVSESCEKGSKKRIYCKYCSKLFHQPKTYHNHLAREHNRCFVCMSASDDNSTLKDHIISHTSHFEYPCSFCSDIYQTKSDCLQHLKQRHSEMCCKFCPEWFMSIDDLKYHVRYTHADKKNEEQQPSWCDFCGASFKNQALLTKHQQTEHQKRKIYTCSACRENFRFRYALLDHISSFHKRTIVDNETSFYKCFICMNGYSSQNRAAFIEHLDEHKTSNSFCVDCNVDCTTHHHLEAHRERCHQDFSLLVNKNSLVPAKKNLKQTTKLEADNLTTIHTEIAQSNDQKLYDVVEDPPQHQSQQIMVQTEDGSLLNMNHLILTENGELIIQDLEELMPNEDSDGQIHITNFEQFLLEQNLSSNTEIPYVQTEKEVIIENDDCQNNDESLMQTYKEIFEPSDENMPIELISTQGVIMAEDFRIQDQKYHISEQVEVNAAQVNANQSTLDELGDILLEVAAAAEKEKKPKQKVVRESLWGKKRAAESTRKKNLELGAVQENEPASNFSQAYEFFVKGFDAKKQKTL